MMKTTRLIPALALILVASGANAACGGGGWSKSATPRASVSATPESAASADLLGDLNDSAQVMSVKAGPIAPVRFDSTRFDKLSDTLKLSSGQRQEIAAAKSQIQKSAEALKAAYKDAQDALVNCQGRCTSEGKKLELATIELKKFDPNHAFSDRLSHILKPDQLAQLENADRSAKRQGI
jgi:hypothetical protein